MFACSFVCNLFATYVQFVCNIASKNNNQRNVPIPNRVSNEKVDGNSDVDTDGEIQLSDRQQDIISLLNIDGYTTATKMAKLLGTSKRTIDRDISFLRANGYIRKETKDNRSPWIVIK